MPLLSQRYPAVYTVRVAQLRLGRRLSDRLSGRAFATQQRTDRLPVVVFRHASPLRRRLGSTDPALQEAKVANLRLAVRTLDGLLLRPGETLSFWRRVGPPSARRGYREGLILRRGLPSTGAGGGLCQLANLLHWMALHTPLEVVERHHHSVDPFPDDRRSLPFGTGASVFYNYADLRLRNPTEKAIQLELWLTDQELCGCFRMSEPLPVSYHVYEVDHRFEATPEGVARCNEVWRRTIDRVTGRELARERLMTNRSLVAYPVAPERIVGRGPSGWRPDSRRGPDTQTPEGTVDH